MNFKLNDQAQCAVIGYGSWGTALVKILTENERLVRWHIGNPVVADGIRLDGHNPKYLSDVEFDTSRLYISQDIDRIVQEADVVILATPSAYLKKTLSEMTVSLADKFIGLRVSREVELKGLDITEHGLPSAYGGFAFVYDDTPDEAALSTAPVEPEKMAVPVEAAVPVETVPSPVKASAPGGVKITRVDILCKMERFDALKRAMFDIGITGMTATNVMGCGEQRGKTEGYFRGAKVEATMLPSIQVSIVVCKVPVEQVVETAKRVLYTGHIGDGKIFVCNVENVIKVRTGEEGYDALQDAE